MGFFSRFFKIREQDPDRAETTWAMEDNGSELVLDGDLEGEFRGYGVEF